MYFLLMGGLLFGFTGTVSGQKSMKRLTKGTWKVFAVTGDTYSEAMLDSMQTQKRRFKRDKASKGTFYSFSQDGNFDVKSVASFGRMDQEGTFELIEDKGMIKRKWTYPNAKKKRLGLNRNGRSKEKIRYLRGGYLVLEGRKETTYLYRTRQHN